MLTKQQNYFFILLVIFLGSLFVLNFIPPINALFVMVFSVVLFLYQYFLQKNKPLGFYFYWFAAIVLGLAIGLYRPAGFNYPLVLSVNQLYAGGLPFDLFLNTAKTLTGYCIIILLSSNRHNIGYINSRSQQLLLVAILSVLVLTTAYTLLDLQIHIKTLQYILTFGVVNLLATCVSEEAFMRWLLQAQIQGFFARRIKHKFWQEFLSLVITTVIFVAIHFAHNPDTIIVFALAGFAYGLVYTLTKSLLAAIAVHFIVNIIHFSLLTYPVV